MVCGSRVWRDPSKILSRKDLRLKYSGTRSYARAARPSSDRPGGRRSKNCWESSRACSQLALSETLSKGCSSHEPGIFLWKPVEEDEAGGAPREAFRLTRLQSCGMGLKLGNAVNGTSICSDFVTLSSNVVTFSREVQLLCRVPANFPLRLSRRSTGPSRHTDAEARPISQFEVVYACANCRSRDINAACVSSLFQSFSGVAGSTIHC